MKRRICLWLAVVAAVVTGWAGPAHAQSPPSGPYIYQLIQNWHSGQCVTAFGSPGPYVVQQWTCWAYSYQQWRIVPTDSGWFELVVASTGECMEVDGASQEDNHRVVKNFCNGRYNQQWTAVPAPVGNGFFFLVARHSGKCLAILSESLVVGANLVQYACSPYSWAIDPIGGSYWRFA
jgi:Ricin-type beta-trefoil lectin domain-like